MILDVGFSILDDSRTKLQHGHRVSRIEHPVSSIEKPATRQKGQPDTMTDSDLDDFGQQFLIQLFEQTKGDVSIQVSMYDIGEQLGMDRDTAAGVAQELMGRKLAEIRTLSGGIGISADGSARIQELMGPLASGSSEAANLGNATVLTSAGQQTVDQVLADLKNQTGSLGLDFDALGELMADLKTMEAQLGSSRPKTAIIRECLRSVLGVVGKAKNRQIVDRLRKLVEG